MKKRVHGVNCVLKVGSSLPVWKCLRVGKPLIHGALVKGGIDVTAAVPRWKFRVRLMGKHWDVLKYRTVLQKEFFAIHLSLAVMGNPERDNDIFTGFSVG